MYKELEDIIMNDSQRNITHPENYISENQKSSDSEITNDKMCCKDFTESLCLYIQNKICIMEILHTLVRTLNMNEDENEENVYRISNKFI